MTKQNIGGQQLDLLTAGELSAELHKHLTGAFHHEMQIERLRGFKLIKLPIIKVTAAGAAFTLANNPPSAPCGPESGYIWMVPRLLITSSGGGADTAVVSGLYVASDSTNPTQSGLIDVTGCVMHKAYFTGTKGLFIKSGEQLFATITGATIGNTYSLSGHAIEVPTVMQGKLLD